MAKTLLGMCFSLPPDPETVSMDHAPRTIRQRQIHPEQSTARKVAREYFKYYPKDRYDTEVETWRELQSQNIEFTMKRLREPKGKT
jgi:hypothetical protein